MSNRCRATSSISAARWRCRNGASCSGSSCLRPCRRIWDSLRISLGWAWTWLVVAELVAATSGLGYRITTAQRFFQTDLIFGYLLILGILGLATDQAMKYVGRRLFRYREVALMAAPKLVIAGLGKTYRTGPRRYGGARAASTSPSARTSSSPWSGPRAAASPRCCPSPPASNRMTRDDQHRRRADHHAGSRSRRGVPELHPAALADRARQCRIRLAGGRPERAARQPASPAPISPWSASTASRMPIRASFRAACGSAWPSPGR